MNTVLFVTQLLVFSENLFLVSIYHPDIHHETPILAYTYLIIVAFLENASIGYSLESLCVCVCVCVCPCVCVCFCTITEKEIDLGTRNRNTL